MGLFDIQHMILLFLLALMLFGPKKLPELARLLGKGLSEFRRAKNELKTTFDTHMRELERETQLEEAKKNPSLSAAPSYSPYSYAADEYGKVPTDYSYNGSESSYPSEPPVESHASNGVASASEPPALPPASAVPGTVPRSTSMAESGNHRGEEHPA